MQNIGKILCAVFRKNRRVSNQRTNGPTIRSLTSTDVENCNATSSGRLNVRSTSSACRTVQPVRRHGNMARWPDGILSKNLITSQSNKKDYRKWSTTSHMALWIIQKHILVTSAWCHDQCHFWMICHDMARLANAGKHLVLKQYAISSRSNRPNSRKLPKTSFLGFWIIQKWIFVIFEWSLMIW